MDTKAKSSGIRDRLLPAILLGAACSVGNILYIPYTFYVPFQTVFGLTNAQIGSLTAAYASLAVPGYLVGGWLGDKFNAKKLVVISVLSTSLLVLWMAMIPSYKTLLLIYFIMSFTLGLLLWTSQTKCVRLLGKNEEQGRLNGVALTTDAVISVTMFVGFAALLGDKLSSPAGMRMLLLFFAVFFFLVGLGVLFFYDFDKYSKMYGTESDDEVNFKLIFKVFKMPVVWIMAGMSFGSYVAGTAIKYFNPYLCAVYAMPVALASIFSTVQSYGIPIFTNPIGGAMRDKAGSSTPVILKTMIPALVLLGVFVILPKGPNYLVLAVAVALVMFAIYRLSCNFYYTALTELDVPINFVGTIIGVAFMLGYCSDLFLPAMIGTFLDRFGNNGYYYTFAIIAVGILIYIAAALWLKAEVKKRKLQKEAEAK